MYPRFRRLEPSFLLILFLVLTPSVPPARAATAEVCVERSGPGATLLFPWFEVDLAGPKGRTTLISIQNTLGQPVLTNVVLWTNCGLPVLAFNLVVPGDGVRSIDLRDLIVGGRLPASGLNPFDGCASPLAPADLDEDKIFSLQARLTGQPDPADGLCYSQPLEPADLATGYVTADLVTECSETIRTPRDPGYLGEDGITQSLNVLWGDFFLLDGPADLAQGIEAVVLTTGNPASEGLSRGFYGFGDDRRRLGSRYRARLLQGGAFDGGTELLAWVKPVTSRPFHCEAYACVEGLIGFSVDMLPRRESGEESPLHRMDLRANAMRLKPGSEELPIETGFGTLDVEFFFHGCKSGKCSPPTKDPAQAWLLPIYTAQGRYSVGVRPAPLNGRCSIR